MKPPERIEKKVQSEKNIRILANNKKAASPLLKLDAIQTEKEAGSQRYGSSRQSNGKLAEEEEIESQGSKGSK